MKRRRFLQGLASSPLLTTKILTGSSLLATLSSAYAASGKTLVVVFQRGGCDGLNVVIPYGEDEYYNLRPDIGIAPPGSGPDAALYLDDFYGLHPTLPLFQEIFQRGDMAILPTVHYTNGNRSHFTSQDYIESGAAGGNRLIDGWLNRHLASLRQDAELRAISFGSLSHALQGAEAVTTTNRISSLSGNLDDMLINRLSKLYQQPVSPEVHNRLLLQKHGSLALDNLRLLDSFDAESYTPENGAVYPDSSYGQQLREVAQLIKASVGLEVATVNSGGWDHHSGQGGAQGTQANRLMDFSAGIAALYHDLGSVYMNNVVILTMTEFGRTAKQNASFGTDHGNASTSFIIGKQVNGGIYGAWPGLMPEQLYKGRYLSHTTEFTDIFAEILTKHLGDITGLPAVLPGTNYQPVGFL